MRRVAGNDLLDIIALDGESAGARFMHNPRDALDGRARMVLDLVKAWGMGVAMSDLMHGLMEDHAPHIRGKPKESIDEFVIRCAEVVDAAYSEIERRGWLVRVPALEE